MYKGALLCFPNFPKEVPSFHPYATNTDLFFPTSLYHLPPALPGTFCLEQRALRYPRPGRHGENNPESPDSHRQPRGTSGAPQHCPRSPPRAPAPLPPRTRLSLPRREGFPAGVAAARFPLFSPRLPAGRRGGQSGTSAPGHGPAAPPGRTLPAGGLRRRSTPRAAAGAAPSTRAPPRPLPAERPTAPARPRSAPRRQRAGGHQVGAGGPDKFPGGGREEGPPRAARDGARRGWGGSTYSRFSCGCSCRCMASEKPKRLPGSPRRLITLSVSRLKAPASPGRRGR